MIDWIKRRTTLEGRATRTECAITTAAVLAIFLLVGGARLGDRIGYDVVPSLMLLLALCFVAWIEVATQVRRLHDIGLSGWWWWVLSIPAFGTIGMLLLLFVGPDTFNRTKYYPDPRTEKQA